MYWLTGSVLDSRSPVARVTSVSVGFQSKERPKSRICDSLAAREMGASAKVERGVGGIKIIERKMVFLCSENPQKLLLRRPVYPPKVRSELLTEEAMKD